MRLSRFAAQILILGCSAGFGQTFEAASVKQSTPRQSPPGVFVRTRGGPGTASPDRITSSKATLKGLLINAYNVQAFQVAGPAWIETERYDVTAKVPSGATREQVRIMWQNLLVERFGVILHHELREFQIEELVVAKDGPKLSESEIDPNAPPPSTPTGLPKLDGRGFPRLTAPGMVHLIKKSPNGPIAHTAAKAQPISQLVIMLGNQLRRPVLDRTGLTGKYDFTLEFVPDMNGIPMLPRASQGIPPSPQENASAAGPNLGAAIEQQLGLRLVSGTAKLDVIVIDRANKIPTEN